jgi:amicyanin
MSHQPIAHRRPLRARLTALALAAVVTALGVLALATSPAQAAQHAITIKQYMFMPGSMTIHQGDTITWTNEDTVGHDVEVTSGPASFHSPMLSKGQSWSFTFTTAGTYSYICSVHPDMKATIVVAAAPVRSPAPAAAAAAPAHQQQPQRARTTSGAVVAAPAAPATAAARTAKAATRTPPVAAATPAVVTPGSDAALDPLLLVAGVALAVVVFCLLLLTSQPERPLL